MSHVKRPVMTYAYSVTNVGMADQFRKYWRSAALGWTGKPAYDLPATSVAASKPPCPKREKCANFYAASCAH